MTTYYTGKGDDGTTGMLSNKRVSKSDPLIDVIGDIDELNSSIGVALAFIDDGIVEKQLRSVQNVLFIMGADLSSTGGRGLDKAQVRREEVEGLENAIKGIDSKTPQLKKFVLPGGGKGAAHLHLSRAMARRAERSAVSAAKDYRINAEILAYLNRLSSYLFAAAVYLNHVEGVEESHPTY